MIKAEIVLDSVSHSNKRITTFELTLPKQLLAQLNTHRSLSRNAASSRAIPTKKFLQSVREEPVMPVWTENRPGMTGDRIEDKNKIDVLNALWLDARDYCMQIAELMAKHGSHKQTVYRLLEPWFYAKIVCTATELDWFFHLRDSGSAQEEIAILARAMKEALAASTPQLLEYNSWHIPYILPEEKDLPHEDKLKISVARCARVSYKTHDDELLSTLEKDLKLYTQLLEEKHASPFEHQAYASPAIIANNRSANFRGWNQYRKILEL
jgi:thymidylate synthase ThyX